VAAQPRRIVVGFDGTEGARRALDAAAQLTGYGSTLAVISVARDDEPDALDPLTEARERLLKQLVAATYIRRVGDPADEIVTSASDLDADLIVVGRRGGEDSPRPLPGSVSVEIVRRAACDVLVVG